LKPTYVSPEQILAGKTTTVLEICQELRAIIKQVVPDVLERGYPGWKAIGYTHTTAGYFCAIFPFSDSVKLYFENGALVDKQKILKGGGKKARYLEFRSIDDVDSQTVRWFVVHCLNL
jgi:hypothetical protein